MIQMPLWKPVPTEDFLLQLGKDLDIMLTTHQSLQNVNEFWTCSTCMSQQHMPMLLRKARVHSQAGCTYASRLLSQHRSVSTKDLA